MTTEIYIPYPDSLAERVCLYFFKNPSDELDTLQIKNRFDVSSINSVKHGLVKPVDAGLLVLARDAEGNEVYGTGRNFEAFKPRQKIAPEPAPVAAPAVPAGKKIPAKKGKHLPADEDYSTTYKPPVLAVAAPSAPSMTKKTLDDCVIEDDVPMPVSRSAKAQRLLESLKPGQSVGLSMDEYDVMNKVKTNASKSKQVQFKTVTYPKWHEFRIWRVA